MIRLLCTGGSLRGRGWKYGSGFVDGIFPVLSPIALQILEFAQNDPDFNKLWSSLDTLPASHTTWDDVINVVVQLRLNKQWDSIVLVRTQNLFPLFYLLMQRSKNNVHCFFFLGLDVLEFKNF